MSDTPSAPEQDIFLSALTVPELQFSDPTYGVLPNNYTKITGGNTINFWTINLINVLDSGNITYTNSDSTDTYFRFTIVNNNSTGPYVLVSFKVPPQSTPVGNYPFKLNATANLDQLPITYNFVINYNATSTTTTTAGPTSSTTTTSRAPTSSTTTTTSGPTSSTSSTSSTTARPTTTTTTTTARPTTTTTTAVPTTPPAGNLYFTNQSGNVLYNNYSVSWGPSTTLFQANLNGLIQDGTIVSNNYSSNFLNYFNIYVYDNNTNSPYLDLRIKSGVSPSSIPSQTYSFTIIGNSNFGGQQSIIYNIYVVYTAPTTTSTTTTTAAPTSSTTTTSRAPTSSTSSTSRIPTSSTSSTSRIPTSSTTTTTAVPTTPPAGDLYFTNQNGNVLYNNYSVSWGPATTLFQANLNGLVQNGSIVSTDYSPNFLNYFSVSVFNTGTNSPYLNLRIKSGVSPLSIPNQTYSFTLIGNSSFSGQESIVYNIYVVYTAPTTTTTTTTTAAPTSSTSSTSRAPTSSTTSTTARPTTTTTTAAPTTPPAGDLYFTNQNGNVLYNNYSVSWGPATTLFQANLNGLVQNGSIVSTDYSPNFLNYFSVSVFNTGTNSPYLNLRIKSGVSPLSIPNQTYSFTLIGNSSFSGQESIVYNIYVVYTAPTTTTTTTTTAAPTSSTSSTSRAPTTTTTTPAPTTPPPSVLYFYDASNNILIDPSYYYDSLPWSPWTIYLGHVANTGIILSTPTGQTGNYFNFNIYDQSTGNPSVTISAKTSSIPNGTYAFNLTGRGSGQATIYLTGNIVIQSAMLTLEYVYNGEPYNATSNNLIDTTKLGIVEDGEPFNLAEKL